MWEIITFTKWIIFWDKDWMPFLWTKGFYNVNLVLEVTQNMLQESDGGGKTNF